MMPASNKTEYIQDLFEEIFSLIQQENDLLDKDDIDNLPHVTNQRIHLLNEAWNLRNECAEGVLRELFQKVQKLQDGLITKAQAEYDAIKEQLVTRKKQSGYFSNAQKRAAYTDKAFYMNKVS